MAKKAKQLTFTCNAFVFLSKQNVFSLAGMDQKVCEKIQIGDEFNKTDIFKEDMKIVFDDSVNRNPFKHEDFINLSTYRSNLIVPIYFLERLDGFILVTDKIIGDFSTADRRVLSMLASMTGIFLQNAFLYQPAHYLAVLEERDRLSRELHDDTAQRLAYFKMETDVIRRYSREKNQNKVIHHLARLEKAIDETCFNLREDIFNLREVIMPNESFIDSLTRYLDNYRKHFEIDVTLSNQASFIPNFDSNEVTQISRIIQEALINVRKHARANHVVIELFNTDDDFTICIHDDGIGFHLSALNDNSTVYFGTKIMRERACCIGGKLEIDTLLNYGTKISIHIPVKETTSHEKKTHPDLNCR